MRILHSIQTCRNITRYYCPATRALSSSDQTAVACVNPLAEYAPVKTDLAGKNDYSPVDHCRISRKCLNFDSNEQRKIKFLAEHSDFFSKIINSAQSEVQVKTTASSLELTGLHGNILQYERELVHLLQSLASTDFSIPLQVGAVLGISSPDKLVSKSALARKVLLELSYDTFSGRANIVATGPTEDVRIFQAGLQSMADKVHSANHAVPGHVMSSKNFLKFCAEFNSLSETVVTIQKTNEAVQIWSSNALNLAKFRKDLDEILEASLNQTVVSVPLRNMRNHKTFNIQMFTAQKIFPRKHVTLSWKSYDGKEETLMMSGWPAAVEEAAAEAQRFDKLVRQTTVSIPPKCLMILGDVSLYTGSTGSNVFIDKPTLEKPELTLFGDEANIRIILLRIFKFLKANCAAKDFSQIDSSLCFSYSDYDEFRHDENNLRIFSATFPKADIRWKTDPDGSIHVKISSSIRDLGFINNILKRNRKFQLPHSNRNISISSLVSVLQQSDKLGDEVLVSKVDDENLLLTCYKKGQYDDASKEIQKMLADPTFQCTRNQTNKKLLLSGNLLNEIRSAAQTYEVSVGFGDDSNENTFVIDVAGSAGNCEIFKTYLDLRLASLEKLSLRFPGDQNSAYASRILQAIDGKKEDKIVVLHDPKLHEFWIGGTQETVESLHTSLSNHMHEERVFYHDPRISEYLRGKIEEISKEFAAVDINLDTESSEIRLSGFQMEVKVLSEKIKRIVSDHGVYEGKFYGINQYERGRQRFLKFFTNKWSSLTDKISCGLAYDEDRDEVNFQIIGEKSLIKETVDTLNRLGRYEHVAHKVELPYRSSYYLNHLQQTLGLPDVPDDASPHFSINGFWGPLVDSSKTWYWDSLDKSPDQRKSWIIQLSGDRKSVIETLRTINTTIENLNFHQIAFVSEDPVFLKVLLQSDFLVSAANDDGVKFNVEYEDYKKNKTFINVYGRDKDKVDELVKKINNRLSAGVKSATIECSDYVGRFYPLGTVFYKSRLIEKLKSRKIYFTFEKNGLQLSFVGEPSSVNEVEQESREWLENLTMGSYTFFDAYSEPAQKVNLNRFQNYYKRRWNRVNFKVSKKEWSISYFGSKEDVAEVDKYMANEVSETFIKDSDPESLAAVARVKSHFFGMYPGVHIVDDRTKIHLRGEKHDVAAVVALLEEATKNKEIRDFTLHLNMDNRLLDIPYTHAKTMFTSSKFKTNWPSLEFIIRGSEIQLVGTQEDIEESSDILANMVIWKVPDQPLKSRIVFSDHRSPEGNFRDSHWIPEELLDKVFVVRNKGWHNSHQVELYGRADDIAGVSGFYKHVLPRLGLTHELFPITPLQSEYLRGRHGTTEVLSPFEDKVSYAFDRIDSNIELAGESLFISQMKKSLMDFAFERFKEAAVQNKHQYWTARHSDWVALNFPRARFNDATLRVYGHVNDVNGVMATLDRADSRLSMEEMDVFTLQIPEDDDDSAYSNYKSSSWMQIKK